MMSRQSRWPQTLANNKINKPVQKKGGKEVATLSVPVSGDGKQTGNSASKSSAGSGRSNSVSSRGGDSTTGSKVGSSLKRSSTSQQSSTGHQSTRPASRSSRPAIRLSSSRSFSSLHTSSFTAAPFMRTSRSLNRLDQRDETKSQEKKGQSTINKSQDSVKLSSSLESLRDNKDQCHGDNTEEMKTSTASPTPESTSSVISTACHHHCNKVKKQELKRSALPQYHWLKCLERSDTATSNFKKGWMMQQDPNGQWQKHWFVLNNQILRFYKDSVADEAADMDGEINLSTCFDIRDYPGQKNCGFQIHTRDGVYTLCAMTSGMRRNWVQAVLKNVRPTDTLAITSSPSQQHTQQQSASPLDVLGKAEESNNTSEEHCKDGQHEITNFVENMSEQQEEQQPTPQPETEHTSALESFSSSLPTCVSPSASSASSHVSLKQRVEEGEDALCQQCPHVGTTEIVTSTSDRSVNECLDEHSDTQIKTEQTWQQDDNTHHKEEQQVLINSGCECIKEEKLLCGEQTGQLVKELEKTQKELCRLQQLNRNLQDELQQEREMHLKSNLHSTNSTLSSDQTLALQQLQKVNHELRYELEAQKRIQEEAKEAELRRRVDLLAQQAQLLVTGDATALAQAHLEQDRRRFQEQQMEWEHCVASLKSQLSISEELRTEAESRLTQLRQEVQGYCNLQQEADKLRENFQEVSTQLRAYEDTQVQKEARLQKHLMLLQASQERERRSLVTSLEQAEQNSHNLQEQLNRAVQQVESLTKSQTWTQDIEEAQQQLQEELAHTVSAVQRLQEERDQFEHRCQELQTQLSETDGEMSRLQNRLKTEETHYYNLEHSYEGVCEELQVALGKVQQRETETQDMREGYERLLDRKEQELSEALLKMEVLGNSLEETEMKLNEMMKVSSGATDPKKKQQITETSDAVDVQNIDHYYAEQARTRSRSIDSSHQYLVTAGDDPEKFMSVIQLLETKLYVTEEKLRDITQTLEEHQSHISCQDPHLCSQLTQSRATAQHLSLLLHSQAKHSQRFAQETENRCRMLVGRFQVSLNIVQACRERLQSNNLIDITDFEKQLATVAACLQQGEKDAEKQKQESHDAIKVGERILNDWSKVETNIQSKPIASEDDSESVGKCLLKELFVLDKMASALKSQEVIGKLPMVLREDDGDVAHRYKSIISQIIVLKVQSGRRECDNSESLESVLARVCTEAELIYSTLKFQQQYEDLSLADINPPELALYEEQVDGAAKPHNQVEADGKKVESEEEPALLEKLISRLQRRAKFLRQLSQELSDDNAPVRDCSLEDNWENDPAADLNWMHEQAKMIYLSHRLFLDLEQALKQSEEKLQAMCKEQDITLMGEQEAFNKTLCRLQEDNSLLREELERAEQKIISVDTGNQKLLEDMHKIEGYHEQRVQKLEEEFQEKIRELQQIHEEEMKHLHGYYSKSCVSKEKQNKTSTEVHPFTENTSTTPGQTGMERGDRMLGGSADFYQEELEKSERFTVMEKMHQKLICDLQRQHQKEVAKLLTEKDQLLKEETAATMSAMVAMRRAHKEELAKSRRSQHIRDSADITQLHMEYEKDIQLLHKELELLSIQHTQKCLENSQLNQELQDERKSLMQYQKENQDLKKKQREADEIAYLQSSVNGTQSQVASQSNDFYEMEVILRAREAEMQFLRQEAASLRDELKLARMDKIYAQNKLKAFCAGGPDGLHHDANNLYEDVKFATWSPGRDESRRNQEDAAAIKNDAAFLKKSDKKSLYRHFRGMRSKSLKEGLSVQERMKLFESF
ncbi:early endosome antigen 1 isoform X3 [Sphaeramia orbicularis]|uniref:early endosome antigen 1 isoform X3 n=1 Tax=Sphaeramia orbicularis TaxID=375764 RepID=UPI00117FC3C6|nr:early endosome antigen 1-like isoform X3 [Sphaeramia orbicularis]